MTRKNLPAAPRPGCAVRCRTALRRQIDGYIYLGSPGEICSPPMAVLPMAYRIWDSPPALYDGMIFVSRAHPTQVFS